MLPTPDATLAAQLPQRELDGTFEAHLTVTATTDAERERFRAWCRDAGVKCVLIELSHGTSRSQPMTASHHHGRLGDVCIELAALTARLRQAGFDVIRTKLEAVAAMAGLPNTDEDAAAWPAETYFEFHVKLLLPIDVNLDAVAAVCAAHQAHLSRNALKREADGRSERFVTLRCYGVGRTRAFAAFDSLCADLAAADWQLGQRIREFSLYDSAAVLDAGWTSTPTGASQS